MNPGPNGKLTEPLSAVSGMELPPDFSVGAKVRKEFFL